MTAAWKPRTIKETDAWLKDKQESGKKFEGEDAADLLATALSNLSELIVHALFDYPDATNYLKYCFVGDQNHDYDMDVVLLKKGASYPPNEEIDALRAKLAKIQEHLLSAKEYIDGIECTQPCDSYGVCLKCSLEGDILIALMEYRGETE